MPHTLLIYGKHGQRPLRSVQNREPLLNFGPNPEIDQQVLSDDNSCFAQMKQHVANAGEIDSTTICLVNSEGKFDKTAEKSAAIYVINLLNANEFKKEKILENVTRQVTQQELSLEKRRRFAIIFYDDENDKDGRQFSRAWEEAKADSNTITVETLQSFDDLEKNQRLRDEEALSKAKRERFFGALPRFLFSSALWFSLSALLLGITSLLVYKIPDFLIVSSTAFHALMNTMAACLAISVTALIVTPVILLFHDYEKSRAASLKDYFSKWPVRIRNWHVDHKLQASFLYLGLIGSLVALTVTLVFGVDASWFEFISNIYSMGFSNSVFNVATDPVVGKFIGEVFAAVMFTLSPLALGYLASNAVALDEDGVSPSRDREATEVSLSKNGIFVRVRHCDELESATYYWSNQENTSYNEVLLSGQNIRLKKYSSVGGVPDEVVKEIEIPVSELEFFTHSI